MPTEPAKDTSTMLNPAKELTLIVAATKTLGIGRANALPWPRLKGEMAFFARVTKRLSVKAERGGRTTTEAGAAGGGGGGGEGEGEGKGKRAEGEDRGRMNAVVMGRKTWESIPTRLRPLGGRFNVVISRSLSQQQSQSQSQKQDNSTAEAEDSTPQLTTSNFSDAITRLSSPTHIPAIDRIFVIGGSSIYDLALKHEACKRVLLTKIKEPEYECDTFFPVDLGGEGAKGEGWRENGEEEWRGWTGEVGAGKDAQGEVAWEFCLFERDGVWADRRDEVSVGA